MIQVNSIAKSFAEKKVIENLSLEVKNQEILSLLGPNGCGKTTLLNILSGLIRQDKGEIYINDVLVSREEGRKTFNVRPSDRKVGYVFQTISLFPHMRVEDNVAYGLKAFTYLCRKLKKERKACLTLWGFGNSVGFIRVNSAAGKSSASLWQGP